MFKTLKTNAKRAMSGAWGRGIGIMFLTMIPAIIVSVVESVLRMMIGVPNMVDYTQTPELMLDNLANIAGPSIMLTLLMSVLMYLVTAPMVQGTYRWFFRRTGGENDGATEVFHYFESGKAYKRSLALRFFIDLRITLWSVLLMIPFVIIMTIAIVMSSQEQEGAVIVFAMLLMFAWIVLMTVVLLIIQLRYFLAPYVLADNPELTAGQALKSGIQQMRGHKGKVFMFGLSFLLWYLPVMLIMVATMAVPFAGGISSAVLLMGVIILLIIAQFAIMFYLYAYQGAAMAMYARYIIESGRAAQNGMTREYTHEPTLPGALETAQSYGTPDAPGLDAPETAQDYKNGEPPSPEL